MKKIIGLALILTFLLIGCNKDLNKDDFLIDLGKKMESIDKYDIDAEMELTKEEGSIIFNVNVKYLSPNYYKVTLKNKDNNNIQVIIKNEEGTYVVSPALNKSFKFQGDWPLNSSQGYLLQSIYKDLLNDKDKKINIENNKVIIEHKINHKTNSDWIKQKVTFNPKKLMPETVIISDEADNTLVKVIFKNFNFKPNFTSKEFDVEDTNSTMRLLIGEGTIVSQEFKEVTFKPEGVDFVSKLETVDEKITMATFSGDYNYTIVQKQVEEEKTLGCNYLYNDIVYLDSGIGLLGNNVLTFYDLGIEYNIYSTDLDTSVMIELANSILRE